MTFLALMLLFPLLWQEPRPVGPDVEPSAELCELARELARQPACLAAGDCEAEKMWRRAFGPPGTELAPPLGRPARAEDDFRRQLKRMPGNCPAGPGVVVRRR